MGEAWSRRVSSSSSPPNAPSPNWAEASPEALVVRGQPSFWSSLPLLLQSSVEEVQIHLHAFIERDVRPPPPGSALGIPLMTTPMTGQCEQA